MVLTRGKNCRRIRPTQAMGKLFVASIINEFMANECTHTDEIREVTPSADGCEDCLKMGDTWMHLRSMHDVWPRRLLRLFEKQACDQTLPRHPTSDYQIIPNG
jgi:hypothetical protein